MIGAILWAQWRSMRSVSGRSALSSITGLIFYGFWLLAAYGVQAFLANPENREYFPAVIPPALLVLILYWQFAPVVTATLGASLDLKKLLVYPIAHEHLFFIEVLLRITTCIEMLLILMGIMIGILRNPEVGGIVSFPRVAAAALLFAAANLLLSAGIRSLIERTMLHKRMRTFTMFLAVAFSVIPQYLLRSGHMNLDRFKNMLSPSLLLPWNAAAQIFLNRTSVHNVAQSLLILLTFTAIAYAFGRWQFAAGLRFDGESSTVRPKDPKARAGILQRILRFPAGFFPDPIAAIIEKEMLSLSRMAPFRMIFLTGSALGILLWLPRMMTKGGPPPGFMTENILAFASAYGILMLGQVTYFNCFGFDRSAVQAWFSLPVPIVRTLIAKNIASAFFIIAELGLTVLVTSVLRVPLTPLKSAESLCVSVITALYLVSFGNITSVRFPRMLNPDKVNQGGSSKAINLMLLPVLPLILSPVAIAYWARSVFDSESIFFALLALAALVGAVLYWIAIESATSTISLRRELILTELSRGDGPVSIT